MYVHTCRYNPAITQLYQDLVAIRLITPLNQDLE